MIRAVIAEDNKYMQKYLSDLLVEEGDFEIAALFEDAFEAEKYCLGDSVDLALMDIHTVHGHSGLSAGERIRKSGKKTKVILVTSLVDPDILIRAKTGAADSLWYKDHGEEDLINVIRRTLAGEHIFPERSPNVELKEMFSHEISPRQMLVLRRFVQGYTYDQIASELKMTANGVRWNLDQIIAKGGFENKHELLAAVLSNKLVVDAILKSE